MAFFKKMCICILGFLLFANASAFAQDTLQNEKKVHLIWQVPNFGYYWESEWLREMLSEVDFTEQVDGRFSVFEDNSIIVIPICDGKARDYFEKLHALGYKFGVIQLSDENYKFPDYYSHLAKFVLRNYWHKNFLQNEKITPFPLGYKKGFWEGLPDKSIPAASKRHYMWSFAGQIMKTSRVSMITNMKKIPPYFVYETTTFADPRALPIDQYRDVMLDSIFIPCPRGFWNLDSFRVYEALECGCIPIVEKTPLDYFTLFFGEHPFLSVSTWDDVPALIEDLLSDPERLENRRAECYQWWLDYKTNLKSKVAEIVRSGFDL